MNRGLVAFHVYFNWTGVCCYCALFSLSPCWQLIFITLKCDHPDSVEAALTRVAYVGSFGIAEMRQCEVHLLYFGGKSEVYNPSVHAEFLIPWWSKFSLAQLQPCHFNMTWAQSPRRLIHTSLHGVEVKLRCAWRPKSLCELALWKKNPLITTWIRH